MKKDAIAVTIFFQKNNFATSFFLLMLPIFLSACRQASEITTVHNSRDEFVGYYSAFPSYDGLPTSPEGEAWGYYKDPACLQIVKEADSSYKVEAFITDSRGFSCTFVGRAEPSRNGLKAYPNSPVEKGQHIFIEKIGSSLIIREDKLRENNGFCGAHAGIEGLTFPQKDRTPVRKAGACAVP